MNKPAKEDEYDSLLIKGALNDTTRPYSEFRKELVKNRKLDK